MCGQQNGVSVSNRTTVKFINQFIISRTSAFIFTSPSSDKLRNFSATFVLTVRNADSRRSRWLQRCSGLGYRLVTYFSRHDNKLLCSIMMLFWSTTPAASATQTNSQIYENFRSYYCRFCLHGQLCVVSSVQRHDNNNKWSKNFDKRPHLRLVTPHGGKWIRPTLTPSNTCFHVPARVLPPNGISISSAVYAYTTAKATLQFCNIASQWGSQPPKLPLLLK